MKKHLYVIIPVYKVEKYLAKCLDSVVNQTFRNLSIICVNDGSPDTCGEILQHYSEMDNRIHVITTENRGLSAARNAALEYVNTLINHSSTKEEFISFVDSDDYLEVDAYDRLLSCFSFDIDLVSFGYTAVDSMGKSIREFKPNGLGLTGACSVTRDVFSSIVPSVWSKIFRAELIFKNNIRFPEGVLYEDNYFTMAYLIFTRNIFFSNCKFYNYLVREDSIMGFTSAKKSGCVISFILLSEHFLSFLRNNNLFEQFNDVFWDLFYRLTLSGITFAPSKAEEDELYERARFILQSVNQESSNDLWSHYNYLILNRTFKEYKTLKFWGLLKHKHRADYDKFYILGLPLISYTYTTKGSKVKLFSVVPIC